MLASSRIHKTVNDLDQPRSYFYTKEIKKQKIWYILFSASRGTAILKHFNVKQVRAVLALSLFI